MRRWYYKPEGYTGPLYCMDDKGWYCQDCDKRLPDYMELGGIVRRWEEGRRAALRGQDCPQAESRDSPLLAVQYLDGWLHGQECKFHSAKATGVQTGVVESPLLPLPKPWTEAGIPPKPKPPPPVMFRGSQPFLTPDKALLVFVACMAAAIGVIFGFICGRI